MYNSLRLMEIDKDFPNLNNCKDRPNFAEELGLLKIAVAFISQKTLLPESRIERQMIWSGTSYSCCYDAKLRDDAYNTEFLKSYWEITIDGNIVVTILNDEGENKYYRVIQEG